MTLGNDTRIWSAGETIVIENGHVLAQPVLLQSVCLMSVPLLDCIYSSSCKWISEEHIGLKCNDLASSFTELTAKLFTIADLSSVHVIHHAKHIPKRTDINYMFYQLS